MRTLIIGAGEIGKSLQEVLKGHHETHARDKSDLKLDKVEVLNICYPFSSEFVAETKRYIKQYQPKVTIIHSTVPVGTTNLCGEMVVHSPVHGKHPNLATGIKVFVKYLGGRNAYAVRIAEEFLKAAKINVQVVSSAEASELSKILCTTYYGWNILFMKEVVRLCQEMKLPFHEVYGWNKYYNAGYKAMGMPQFVRPVLEPMEGPIGGHCVVNNCDLLDSLMTNLIKEQNKEYES